MPRHQASLFGGLQHTPAPVIKRAHRRRQIAVLRIDQRQGKIRSGLLQTGDQRPALQIRLRQIAGDADQAQPLNAGLNVGIGIVDHQRLPHADRVVAFIEGEKPVDGPPGTVIQVAHRPMLVQFVDALRPAVGREPGRRGEDHPAVAGQRTRHQGGGIFDPSGTDHAVESLLNYIFHVVA